MSDNAPVASGGTAVRLAPGANAKKLSRWIAAVWKLGHCCVETLFKPFVSGLDASERLEKVTTMGAGEKIELPGSGGYRKSELPKARETWR